MATVGSVEYHARINTSELRGDAADVEKSVRDLGDRVERVGRQSFGDFSKEMSSSFGQVSNVLGGVMKKLIIIGTSGAFGIGAATKASWDQVRAVEQATVALNVYEKDGSKVNKVLEDLIGYARSDLGVLFQREDLFGAAQGLKVMGAETENLTDYVQIMSRSVGLGLTTFDDLNRVVGRVGSTGRLTGIDFDNLTKAGFTLDDSLRGTEVTWEELFTAMDKGIPADAMAGQAETIDGQMVRLRTAFRDLGAAILGVDTDTSKFIEGGLGDRLVQLIDTLREMIKDPEFIAAFQGLGSAIASFAETALPAIINGFRWIVDNRQLITAFIIGLVSAFLAAKVASIAFGIASLVAAGGPMLIAAAAILLIGIIAALAYLIYKNWDSIKEWTASLVKSVVGWFSAIWKGIKDFVGRAWDSVKGAFSGIWQSIKNALGMAITEIAKLPGRIIKALGNMGKLLFSTGKDMINGLISGAGSILKNIGTFLLDKIPKWIVGPFKKALGISSPSKVFMGLGEDTMAGFNVGLGEGLKDPLSSLTDSSRRFTQTFAGGMAKGADQLMRGAGALTSNLSMELSPSMAAIDGVQSAGPRQINNNIQTINIGSELEGEEWLNKLGVQLGREEEIREGGLS